MRLVLTALVLLSPSVAIAKEKSAVAGGEAKQIIRCTAKSKPDITMTLNVERKLKRVVSCISGDFIMDMTPCASNGAYGLSSPTGSAPLSEIVDRWQDTNNHLGGITAYNADAIDISFHGGFASPSSNSWRDKWTFTANRLTGEGKLTEEGKPDTIYACAKANQRF